MKRIILYRYYHKFERNEHLLRFYKMLNPDIPIYGIYGGPEEKYAEASDILKDVLTANYLIEGKSNGWKWRNDDMSYQLWYKDFGHSINFDTAHSIEWDLLYFQSIDRLFAHVPINSLAITGLKPCSYLYEKWYWLKDPRCRKDWEQMMEYFKDTFNYHDKPYGMMGPGIALPRIFFEKMKDTLIPDIALGELRIPMFGQVFNIKMTDTKFFKKWFSKKEYDFFNCMNYDIKLEKIKQELTKRRGRRVFHPFRDDITYDELVSLSKLIPTPNRFLFLFKRN